MILIRWIPMSRSPSAQPASVYPHSSLTHTPIQRSTGATPPLLCIPNTITMSIARSLLRSARPLSSLPRSCSVPISRTYATVTVASSGSNSNAPLLANIEASWEDLPAEEQGQVYQQLKELQKRDWKEMSLDEKKAGESCFFLVSRSRTGGNRVDEYMR